MMKEKFSREKIVYGLAVVAVFGLALFLRLYRITEIPYGLNIDEAGAAYDGYGIAMQGIDRYYKYYPVYLTNFGGGQSALYAYLIAFMVRQLGFINMLIIRIPTVLFGMIAWFFGTLILKESFSKKLALAGSVLLAVLPCFVLLARIGLDCNLFLGAATASIYVFIQAIKRNKTCLYFLAGIGFGGTLYTYALSYMVIPVFCILVFAYLIKRKSFHWKQIVAFCLPLGVLATPLILMLTINTFDLPEIVTGYFTIPKLPEYRKSEIGLGNILPNIRALFEIYFFKDQWLYQSLPNYYVMFPISIPFLILGIQKLTLYLFYEKRCKNSIAETLILFWFFAQTIMGLLIEGPAVGKMNAVYLSLLFLTLWGIKEAYVFWKSRRGKKIFVGVVGGIYLCFTFSFINYYFNEYPEETYPLPFFAEPYADILDEHADVIGEKTVYIGESYIYYALGEELLPTEFHMEEGQASRENVVFSYPRKIDIEGVYIIKDGATEALMKEALLEAGYVEVKEGFYNIYYNLDEESKKK